MMPKSIERRPYLWPVGRGGLVVPERVVAVGRWDSAPIRRAARQAKAQGLLVDLTFGEACKWVIFMNSGHLVLSSESMPVTALGVEDLSYFEEY